MDALLADRTILDIQQLMANCRLSAETLTLYYVDRIRRYDIDKFNAFLALNPDALGMARRLDTERTEGRVRGPMHGIPVLLQDNIATRDGMHTTARAFALRHWQADRDAFLAKQLRVAGAVLLGKANLSEWAIWMDSTMPNGFSTLGGQTRNPYGPFDPLGSSSGSAVAVAANLVTAGMGHGRCGHGDARLHDVAGYRQLDCRAQDQSGPGQSRPCRAAGGLARRARSHGVHSLPMWP